MARPRNDKLYTKIANEAAWQALHNGYTATSYSTIAKACDTTRSVVQRYFPRKTEIGILATSRALDYATQLCEPLCAKRSISDPALEGVVLLHMRSVLFFEFLRRGRGPRQFAMDFLQNRDVSLTFLFEVMEWAYGAINRLDVPQDPARANNLIMSMGGFFELYYHHLNANLPFEVNCYFSEVTHIWLGATGYPAENLDAAVAACAIEADELDPLIDKMNAQFC